MWRAIAILAFLASPAWAGECGSALASIDSVESYSVATVKPGVKKTYFHDETGLKMRAFLIAGDEALLLDQKDDLACAIYQSNSFVTTAGWLKLADLESEPGITANPLDWTGGFQRDNWGTTLTLAGQQSERVSYEGEAYWAMSAELAAQGGLNTGEVTGDDPIINGVAGDSRIKFVARGYGDCAFRMTRLGKRYLLAQDNFNCGGHNVTFTGLYVRVE